MRLLSWSFPLVLVIACEPAASTPDTASTTAPAGLDILGGGSHSMDGLVETVLGTSADGLDVPRDLAFHTVRGGELYVLNRADSSVTILFDADTDQPVGEHYRGANNVHFTAQPSALAFNDAGEYASIHEEDQPTQGNLTPADFMGPTLQSTDLAYFDGAWASHLDMLHNSPDGMGIAWERDRVFWVFDGYHSSLTRYDFHDDHGPGGTDHSDGEIGRALEGEVSRLPDVPSHMEVDHDTGLLYAVDGGNNRVIVVDTATGTKGGSVGPNYDGIRDMYALEDVEFWTLIDGDAAGLVAPSGLALHEGMLFLTDNATGIVHAFDLDTGEAIDWLDTGRGEGALMGITFDDQGRLYGVDAVQDEVWRIEVAEG